MLLIISDTRGFTVQTKNGSLGTVGEFLFDDTTWKMRWMVVDTGQWLAGRKVLVHPSSIGHVALTKAEVENSPDSGRDLPVSQRMRSESYGPSDGSRVFRRADNPTLTATRFLANSPWMMGILTCAAWPKSPATTSVLATASSGTLRTCSLKALTGKSDISSLTPGLGG